MMKLYNSLSKQTEDFKPLQSNDVGIYSCGMTVYDYAHIGHGRKYVTDDLLRRTLQYDGYKVKFVQNVTDVGHLTSDADEGEDKLEKGASKQGKTVWEVADFFTEHFYSSMEKLNILDPDVVSKATEHIDQQIKLVEKLFENGFAYDTKEAVYFDVTKFEDYGKMFGQNLDDKKVAVRKDVKKDDNKKHPADFALWFKRVGRFKDHVMHWDSPWGSGFPGWHVECSAMSMEYLGEQFDIHTGGEDHKPIHHPNEIAQSEAATGKKPFVNYWVHTAFLTVDGTKMSKSLNNFYTVDDVEEKGYNPLALRYFYLTAHYRKKLNFTWEALESAQNAYSKLLEHVKFLKQNTTRTELSDEKDSKRRKFASEFKMAINNDLNMPQALAVVWEVIKSNIPSVDKLDLLYDFDDVLGLNLRNTEMPREVVELINKRKKLRNEKKFEEADKLRDKILDMGYEVRDS